MSVQRDRGVYVIWATIAACALYLASQCGPLPAIPSLPAEPEPYDPPKREPWRFPIFPEFPERIDPCSHY